MGTKQMHREHLHNSAGYIQPDMDQAAASVPDKDGTLCPSVQLWGEYFALEDMASASKLNLPGLRNRRLEVN